MFSWYAAVIHLEDVLAALLYFLIYPRRTAFPLRLTAGGIGTTLVVGILSQNPAILCVFYTDPGIYDVVFQNNTGAGPVQCDFRPGNPAFCE